MALLTTTLAITMRSQKFLEELIVDDSSCHSGGCSQVKWQINLSELSRLLQ